MVTVAAASNQMGEKDLTLHLRGLVEGCFEENQYEPAIAVLDEIRSSKFKPFPPHIRQLIYIALYPPPSVEDEAEEEALKLEPGSPSKVLSKRQKASLAPSLKASAAARDVLMKYARTNTPASLARALPSYAYDPDAAPLNNFDMEDSYIAREALRIQRARCCWEIIKEGFARRDGGTTFSSPRKARPRRASRRHHDDDEGWRGDDTEPPAPVSDHAWGVLGWFLTLFERDEEETEHNGVRYSSLFLEQIPPSRAERAARWDVGLPLDVVFYALQQDSEVRRFLGVRLLALLINLGSTTLLDFPMLLNAASTRISELSVDTLEYLLSALPITQAAAQFKVHLCRHALGGTTTTTGKPKPQARARAQPRRRIRTEATDASADADGAAVSQDASKAAQDPAAAVARKYPAISASDVMDLLARPCASDPASAVQTLCLKGELVASYALVQQLAGGGDRDGRWLEIVRDGALAKAVEAAFDVGPIRRPADTEGLDYVQKRKDALLAAVSVWQTL